MIYLASPYTHTDPFVMEERYLKAMRVTAILLNGGHFVYSPIVHCHPMAVRHEMPKDHLFWLEYDQHMIELSEVVYVLKMEGWATSKGVQSEIEFAIGLNKLIEYIDDVNYE